MYFQVKGAWCRLNQEILTQDKGLETLPFGATQKTYLAPKPSISNCHVHKTPYQTQHNYQLPQNRSEKIFNLKADNSSLIYCNFNIELYLVTLSLSNHL